MDRTMTHARLRWSEGGAGPRLRLAEAPGAPLQTERHGLCVSARPTTEDSPLGDAIGFDGASFEALH